MTADIRQRIADVLRPYLRNGGAIQCVCGRPIREDDQHPEHVAEVLVTELGPTSKHSIVPVPVNYDEPRCDCCSRGPVTLYTGDDGESWICGECRDALSPVTAYGVTLGVRDHYAPTLTYAAGRQIAEEIDPVAKQADSEARAVYQDDGTTVIVWLPAESDPHVMRRHLDAAGYTVGCVSTYYQPAMA